MSAEMLAQLRLFPDSASTVAPRIDTIYASLIGMSLVFGGLICVLIVAFAVRYRRSRQPPPQVTLYTDLRLELLWTIVPLVLALSAFAWGAWVYVDTRSPPFDARRVYVVGRQWMWRVQHPEGRREINTLHVPRGSPVRITLISDDVIHSFFVPAFRIKQDAVPGRYASMWFEASQVGSFRLYCAEYCGTNHSLMIGHIVVMEPADFQAWLASGAEEPLVKRGRRLFERFACRTCHNVQSGPRGPDLAGLFDSTVALETGATVRADEAYLRESILDPNAKVVAGFERLMPTYAGQLDEEAVIALVAYLKTIGLEETQP